MNAKPAQKNARDPVPVVASSSDNYVVHVERLTFEMVREARAMYDVYGPLANPANVASIARALIPDDGREHFGVLTLDTKLNVLRYHEVAIGTNRTVATAPPSVFGPVLRTLGADGLVLVHNHPTGDPSPSRDDLRLTRDLARGAEILGLQLHDHIIIGSGTERFVSLSAIRNQWEGRPE